MKASSVHWQQESENSREDSEGIAGWDRSGIEPEVAHKVLKHRTLRRFDGRDVEPRCIAFHKHVGGIMEALIAAKDFATREQARSRAASMEVMKSKVSNFLCADSFLSSLESRWSELWSCPLSSSGPAGIPDSILGTTGSDPVASQFVFFFFATDSHQNSVRNEKVPRTRPQGTLEECAL